MLESLSARLGGGLSGAELWSGGWAAGCRVRSVKGLGLRGGNRATGPIRVFSRGGLACFKRGAQHKKPSTNVDQKDERYNLIQRELMISWACSPRLEASSGHPQGRVAHSKSNPEQGACPKNLPNRLDVE